MNARVDEVPAHYCHRCRGVLVAQAGFVSALRQLARTEPPPPYPPRPVNLAALKRSLACPLCHHKMDVHPYYGPGNVIIDTCGRCRVIWLDHGELSRIVSGFAQEDD
ncbi:MAG: zf-TFIIB domain-containing protein [Anaerolineales bacterium]|nr:zf-TFIIB domain-containing protein [Anaerolineales bacterium]